MIDKELPDFAIRYLETLERKGRKPSTVKRYTYDLIDFFNWLSLRKGTISLRIWKQLTSEEIELFFLYLMEKRTYKVRTIRRIYSVLRQLATFVTASPIKTHAIFSYEPPVLEQLPLHSSEWLTAKECKTLLNIIHSFEGLSDKQQKARPLFTKRNETIIRLFLEYGLSLQEVTQIKMRDVHFERNEVDIRSEEGEILYKISWREETKRCAFEYYKMIPEAVRPRYFSSDPFFIAFDFQRNTFRWSYEDDQPKALTEIAIQKMLRLEVARAGLRKGISAQHLRNTFIIRSLAMGCSEIDIQHMLGLRTNLSLNRYVLTFQTLTEQEKRKLLEDSNQFQ